MASTPGTSAGGPLGVEYLGHAAFRFTTRHGTRIVIDPFGDPYEARPAASYGTPVGSRWFRRQFPAIEADILLVTHPHFDHDAVQRVAGEPTIVRRPLMVSNRDFSVSGYMGQHAGPYGEEFDKQNVVYVIEAEGLCVCHIGDNQADLPAELLKHSGDIDLLILPVDDDCHLLTFEEIRKVIDTLAPRVIVPMHYYVESTTDPASTLGPIDTWLKNSGKVRHWTAMLHQLSAEMLPESREVWVFDPCAGLSTMIE